ncbi:MAG TPA: endonuclease III [Candidatus Krumholzibacterium sp.]|nr:endonuclease III [Candidatus Krumholzibacterium sp.]
MKNKARKKTSPSNGTAGRKRKARGTKHDFPVRKEWFPLGEDTATSILKRIVVPVRNAVREEEDPSVTKIAQDTRSPFRVLVSTVISARTKDEVTGAASERLFALAGDPVSMAGLTVTAIEKAIYPAGFYKVKAKAIKALARKLIDDFDGKVPDTIEELVELPGVGRKTANLTVTLGFGIPGICVDTHVHRVTNRLGVVRTRNPEETEYALRKVLPVRHWIEINDLLVMYGKAVCNPVSPKCSICVIEGLCRKVGVTRSR